jgi:hypothetical protein
MRTYINLKLPPKKLKKKKASGPESGDLRGCHAANLPAEAGIRLHRPINQY